MQDFIDISYLSSYDFILLQRGKSPHLKFIMLSLQNKTYIVKCAVLVSLTAQNEWFITWHPITCIQLAFIHYNDVIMTMVVSQITSLTIVYSIVYSGARSKKTSKLRVTAICAGNSPGTGEFPAQMASYAENVSIWRRHHVCVWFGTNR